MSYSTQRRRNVLSWNGASYEHDLLNRLTRLDTGSETWVYAYTADDERIWAVKTDQSVSNEAGQQWLRRLRWLRRPRPRRLSQ